MSRATVWAPILSGRDRERALALIRAELAATRSPSPETSPCISGGSAGFALLHGYWFLERGDESSEDAAFELAEHAIEHGGALPLQLYAGVVGVGWSIHHLAGRVLPADDALASLDDALLEVVRERPWTRTWDFLQGLVGIGQFALSRSGPDGACVAAVLAHIEELAEGAGEGVAWRTRPEHIGDDVARRYPDGTLIVGAAHGVPAVIWFLTQCLRGESLRSRAAPLLARAVDWLLALELQDGRHNRFPGYIDGRRQGRGDHEQTAPWFRPSWCYADAGLALPLLAAARALGSAEIEDRALAIARRVGGFRHDGSWELDPSLCHGAAGLALICRRLVEATGDESFADSARYWAARAMELIDPPMEGLTQGFLMGATGAALALLALCGSVPPAWDALLLLSDVEVPTSGGS